MAYTEIDYASKAALVRDHKAGKTIRVYQPGPFPLKEGSVALEGPHYPKPHTWYATAEVKDGVIVPGSKIR